MVVSNKEGVDKDAAFLAPAEAFNGILKEGRVSLGRLLSSDKTTDVWVSLKNAVGTGTRISQVWGDVEWKMGENGEKAWNTPVNTAQDDCTVPIEAHLHFGYNDDTKEPTPLTGHTVKFGVSRVVVKEIDDQTGDVVTRIYTTNPWEASPQYPYQRDYPDAQVIYLSTIDAQKYCAFSPEEATDNGDGVFKTQLQVLKKAEVDVLDFTPQLQDQGVYTLDN